MVALCTCFFLNKHLCCLDIELYDNKTGIHPYLIRDKLDSQRNLRFYEKINELEIPRGKFRQSCPFINLLPLV